MPATRRVFISYGRKDATQLAQRLQRDLSEQGFNAWLDTQHLQLARQFSLPVLISLSAAAQAFKAGAH